MGIISSSQLYNKINLPGTRLSDLIRHKPFSVENVSSLRQAIEIMASENVDVLPVLSSERQHIVGILSYTNILASYKMGAGEHQRNRPPISLRRNSLKLLVHGKRMKRFFASGR